VGSSRAIALAQDADGGGALVLELFALVAQVVSLHLLHLRLRLHQLDVGRIQLDTRMRRHVAGRGIAGHAGERRRAFDTGSRQQCASGHHERQDQ
jgi:hypothetical protein